MADVLDVARIEKELQEINQQRSQVCFGSAHKQQQQQQQNVSVCPPQATQPEPLTHTC